MAKQAPYFPPHYPDAAGYAADLERELAGYRNRALEMKALGASEEDGPVVDAHAGEKAVLAELTRIGYGPKEPKAEKPKPESKAEPKAEAKPEPKAEQKAKK